MARRVSPSSLDAKSFPVFVPKVDPCRFERVGGHSLPQDAAECRLLRQAFRKPLPGVSAVVAPKDLELSAGRTAKLHPAAG